MIVEIVQTDGKVVAVLEGYDVTVKRLNDATARFISEKPSKSA